MKYALIFWLFLVGMAYSCSGDCLSCHPKLQDTIMSDERHKPMLNCIGCHKEESTGTDECGKDCFACHRVDSIDNSIKEHEVITTCRDCHTSLETDSILQESVAPAQSSDLKSLIFQ